MLIASLKDVIRNQAAEIEKLQSQLKSLSTSNNDEVRVCVSVRNFRARSGELHPRIAVLRCVTLCRCIAVLLC